MKNSFFAIIVSFFLLASVGSRASVLLPTQPTAQKAELVPKPQSRSFQSGQFVLSSTTAVEAGVSDAELQVERYLKQHLQGLYPNIWSLQNFTAKEQNKIKLYLNPLIGLPKDGYRLSVEPELVTIVAADKGGLFYGVETFLQLLPATVYAGIPIEGEWIIEAQTIEDYPAFEYRGMMLDVARTFTDKKGVLALIDRMARHKLNYFHWHLTDDEGWRIEINSYPKLAAIGGFRGGDSPVKPIYGEWDRKYGGYFTQKDIKEIVAYAQFRNIVIIPEIDLPGHSRAAAKVYPEILCDGKVDTSASGDDRRNVWCASKEQNYTMLRSILKEVCDLFPSEYIHIGGDEVLLGQWRACPNCQKLMKSKGYKDAKQLTDHFISETSEILKEFGRKAFVWDEAAASGKLDKSSKVSGWQSLEQSLDATKKGYQTVIMAGNYFYLDMRQSPDEYGQVWADVVDAKRLYSFNLAAAGFNAEQMKNILGVEGTYFAELLVSGGSDFLDYQLHPRLSVLSEVAWLNEDKREWNDFYHRLTSNHLDRLKAMGINYRQFPPIVDYKQETITATAPFKGAEIRFTADGSEPNSSSQLYTDPIIDNTPEDYLFKAFYDGVASPSITPTAKSNYTIGASATKTFAIPLSEITDSEGLWYFKIRTIGSGMRLNKVTVTDVDDDTKTIIGYPQHVNQFHRMRLYADENNKDGVMHITIRNDNPYACDLSFEFERSPYIEPAVKVTSSISQNRRFPYKNAEDYNFTSYARSIQTCKKGDHFTFTFAEPVDAQSIKVATGLYYMPRYHIISGRIQISTDGVNFKDNTQLVGGGAMVYPEGKIKALRIISDMDGNSESAVAIQDLKIKPRR